MMYSSSSVWFVLLVVGSASAARLTAQGPKPMSQMTEAELAKHLADFKAAEKTDAEHGKNGTEIRRTTVYRLQKFSFPYLKNCNAAYEIGELVFMSKFSDAADLVKTHEIIVEYKVAYKVATDVKRARRHYIQYNGGKPNKDPTVYGIDTVGLYMNQRGGWLSFPAELKCESNQEVGEGCAWKEEHDDVVKSIHSSCLMNVVDDGIDGTGTRFSDVLLKFQPPFISREDALNPDSKLALKLFRKGFFECADVWPFFPDLVHHSHSDRRCCCFKDVRHHTPGWVRDGICMADETLAKTQSGREHALFGRTWSVTLSHAYDCGEGKSYYRIDSGRGRCLTYHNENASAVIETREAMPIGLPVENPPLPEHTFESVRPSIVRTNVFGLYHVCPASLGLHHSGCDCSWANEAC